MHTIHLPTEVFQAKRLIRRIYREISKIAHLNQDIKGLILQIYKTSEHCASDDLCIAMILTIYTLLLQEKNTLGDDNPTLLLLKDFHTEVNKVRQCGSLLLINWRKFTE